MRMEFSIVYGVLWGFMVFFLLVCEGGNLLFEVNL